VFASRLSFLSLPCAVCLDATLARASGRVRLLRREHRAAHRAGDRLVTNTAPLIVAAVNYILKTLFAAAPLAPGKAVRESNFDPHRSPASFAPQPPHFVVPTSQPWSGFVLSARPHAGDDPLPRHQIDEPAVKADRHELASIPCRTPHAERVPLGWYVLDEPHLHCDRGIGRQRREAFGANSSALVGRQPQPLELIGR
jgi:hypothetical protein